MLFMPDICRFDVSGYATLTRPTTIYLKVFVLFVFFVDKMFLGLRKPQNILHVIQTTVLIGQPNRRPDRAIGKGHATGGFVGDFHPLAVIGKHDGMLADDVPGAYG